MRRLDVRDPVADRLARCLLERPRSELDRHDLGAEQAHPLDVGSLATHVLGAHEDDALEPEARARGRCGDAVLAGAGLGDDPLLAEPPREHELAERVVDLVRARVIEVLALEVEALPGREPLGAGERRRPARVVAAELLDLLAERRDRLSPPPRPRSARRAPGSASRGRSARPIPRTSFLCRRHARCCLHVGADTGVILDPGCRLERRGGVDGPGPNRRDRVARRSPGRAGPRAGRGPRPRRRAPSVRVVLLPGEIEQASRPAFPPRRIAASRPRTLPSSGGCTWSRSAAVSPASPTQTATESIVVGDGEHAGRGARALRHEHETGQVGAGLDRGGDVLLAREAADLDERAREELASASRPGRAPASARSRRGSRPRPQARRPRPGRACHARFGDHDRGRPGSRATSASWAARSISNVERSRALMPITRCAERDPRGRARRRRAPRRACRARARRRSASARHVVASSRSRRSSSAASAPASRAVRRCSSVEKKPLASRGSVAARARAEVVPGASEALVDEHRDGSRARVARTPGAIAAGSASGRRSPADGERRLISAIAPRPGARKRVREPTHQADLSLANSTSSARRRRRVAGVDRLGRERRRPRPDRPRAPAVDERRGRVQERPRPARPPRSPEKIATDRGGVLAGGPPRSPAGSAG